MKNVHRLGTINTHNKFHADIHLVSRVHERPLRTHVNLKRGSTCSRMLSEPPAAQTVCLVNVIRDVCATSKRSTLRLAALIFSGVRDSHLGIGEVTPRADSFIR